MVNIHLIALIKVMFTIFIHVDSYEREILPFLRILYMLITYLQLNCSPEVEKGNNTFVHYLLCIDLQ